MFIYKIPSFFSNRIYLQKKNKLQQKSKVMTMTWIIQLENQAEIHLTDI